MKTSTIIRRLKRIRDKNPRTLRGRVAQEALEYGDDPIEFFTELQVLGCQSGIITSLIFYSDTHVFYDEFYDEIETMRIEYEELVDGPLKVEGDLKNFYAWFAFEQTAWQFAQELNLEI